MCDKKQKIDPNADAVYQSVLDILANDDAAGSTQSFDELIGTHGAAVARDWKLRGKHPNTLIHELVRKKRGNIIEHLVAHHQFDINEPRASDLCTPLHLAAWTKNNDLVVLLLRLGAEPTLQNKYGEDCKQLVENVLKKDNLVWLDLELTNLPVDGETSDAILECAVIVTDKDLNELESCSWVVHHEEKELQSLSKWHQDNFKAVSEGGNGLFDAVLTSTTNKEAMEEELLALLKTHCPKGLCRLAGQSVHCDREVLLKAMPSVYAWCSHQVIDVSTLNSLVGMWLPNIAATVPPATSYNHRAENDIKSSIAMLKWLRLNALTRDI